MSDVPPSPDANRTTEPSLGAPTGADGWEEAHHPPSAPCPPAYPTRPWYEADEPEPGPVLGNGLDADEPQPPSGDVEERPLATATSIFEPRPGDRATPDGPPPPGPATDDARPGDQAGPGADEPVVRLEDAPMGLAWAETTTLAGFDRSPADADPAPWSTDDGLGRLLLQESSPADGEFVGPHDHRFRGPGLRAFTRDRAQVLYRRQGLVAAAGLAILAVIGALSFPRTWRDPGPGLAIDTGDGGLEADVIEDHPLLQQQVDGDGGGRRASIEPQPGATGGTRPTEPGPTTTDPTTTVPALDGSPQAPTGAGAGDCLVDRTSPDCELVPRAPTTRLVESAGGTAGLQATTTTEAESTTTTTRATTTSTTRRTTTTTRRTTTTARRTTTTKATTTTSTTRRTTTTTEPTTTTSTTRRTTTTKATTTTTEATTTSTTEATTTTTTTPTEASTSSPAIRVCGPPPESGSTTLPCEPAP